MSVIEIKRQVRQRDSMRCTECGMTNAEHIERHGRSLDVHRVTPGGPYTLEGCVTLCRRCHGPKPKSRVGVVAFAKIDAGTRRLAKTVSAWKGIKANEWMSQVIKAAALKELAKMPKELKEATEENDGKS